MKELTEKQVEQVELQLEERGVSLYELRESLLDHVCCAIEQQLEYGKSFSDAFEEAFSAFGQHGLLRIQLETEELLNQKENPMKQTSFISGIIAGALIAIGSYFKMQHWAGANILTLVGMVTILVVFIPSIFVTNYKNEFSTAGKISQISGMISISAFLMGALFKFMHWPMANVLMYAGVGGSLLIYLPLLMYKNSLEKSTVERNKYVIVVFILSIAGLTFMSLRGPSKKYVEGYTSTNTNIEKTISMLSEQEATYIAQHPDDTMAMESKKTADEIIGDISAVKVKLIASSLEISEEEAQKLSIEDCTDLLGNSGIYNVLLNENASAPEALYTKITSAYGKNIIPGTQDQWIEENFNNKSLITCYTNLSTLQLQVKQYQNGLY